VQPGYNFRAEPTIAACSATAPTSGWGARFDHALIESIPVTTESRDRHFDILESPLPRPIDIHGFGAAMKPFRNDLQAAHLRIAQLEDELAAIGRPESSESSPMLALHHVPPLDRLLLWEWWPFAALGGLVALHIHLYGATSPGSLLAAVHSTAPITPWRILLAAGGLVLYLGDVTTRARRGERTALSRCMLMVAIAAGALAYPVVLAAMAWAVVGLGLYVACRLRWTVGLRRK
jgi:hypothetical protein